VSRDPERVQHELDAAQDDLERHIGELKHLIEDKLERPRHAIEAVRRPFAWLDAHAIVATFGSLGLGAVIGLWRSR
jgi:hypothetical protein